MSAGLCLHSHQCLNVLKLFLLLKQSKSKGNSYDASFIHLIPYSVTPLESQTF